MKILIVGGGGREHALAWRLHQSPAVEQIYASPGNPGIAQIATCLPGPDYLALAESLKIDLTVVGPEAPLAAGIVDQFQRHRLNIIGPTQAAAQLETSKIFAKQFFQRASIPTARSLQTSSYQEALDALRHFPYPVVVKADGLLAGKGVIIAHNQTEAKTAIENLGPALVIEEFLQGEEVSFIGLSNGETLIPFTPAQDHKRALNNDQGLNTGGMGAYTDSLILTSAQVEDIVERITLPTLHQMKRAGTPFTGFLYAGLMMTAGGPKLLEYNDRLGDPETQAILHTYPGDLAETLVSFVPPPAATTRSVCITMAAENYPETPRTGDIIHGIAEAEGTGATVFHAGTKMVGNDLVTSGGRVLGVTASAATLREAIDKAYTAVGKIHFRGMHYRTDIGHKGLARAKISATGT